MSSTATPVVESQVRLNVARGSIVIVRDMEWLVKQLRAVSRRSRSLDHAHINPAQKVQIRYHRERATRTDRD